MNVARKERLLDLWDRDPHAALDRVLTEAENKGHQAFLWVNQYGNELDPYTRFGKYRYVSRQDLKGRTYLIEYWDGMVSILFLDVLHNIRTYRNDPI
jgi:hypothetical protein